MVPLYARAFGKPEAAADSRRILRLLTTTDERRKAMARTPIHPEKSSWTSWRRSTVRRKSQLADIIEVPPNRLYQLLAGKRSMTADTALRLSRYFGMSADFWMNLQSAYELDLARQQTGKAIHRIPRRNGATAAPRSAA